MYCYYVLIHLELDISTAQMKPDGNVSSSSMKLNYFINSHSWKMGTLLSVPGGVAHITFHSFKDVKHCLWLSSEGIYTQSWSIWSCLIGYLDWYMNSEKQTRHFTSLIHKCMWPMCVISIDLSGTSLIFQCLSRSWTTKCVASEYSVLLFRCRNDILVQGKHTIPAGDSQKVNGKHVRAKYHSSVGEAGGVQIFTIILHRGGGI